MFGDGQKNCRLNIGLIWKIAACRIKIQLMESAEGERIRERIRYIYIRNRRDIDSIIEGEFPLAIFPDS